MAETGWGPGHHPVAPTDDKEPAETAMDTGEDADTPASVPAEPPTTLELMADLQAGRLDDSTAARLRRRARTEPEAARILRALDRVRAELADLGNDATPAPEVPAAVTARVGAALQAQGPGMLPAACPPSPANHVVGVTQRGPAVHSLRRSAPRMHRLQVIAAVLGATAAVVAVCLGTALLLRPPAPTSSAGPTAEHITVSRPPDTDVPLSDPHIAGLLRDRPDYGALSDPQRRASCLSGLGYPVSTRILGAHPVTISGRPGILIVLPGDTPGALIGLVVQPNCSSADTGLIADTVVAHP
jgi:hypothetical protein